MHTPHTASTRAALIGTIASLLLYATAQAQTPPPTRPVSHAGPRVGVTYLSDGVVDKLQDEGIDVSPAITQFGWQFEKQFNTSGRGPLLVTEWVLLAGDVNIPVNLAVVPSQVNWVSHGGPPAFRVTETERRALRVSLLLGFNIRR